MSPPTRTPASCVRSMVGVVDPAGPDACVRTATSGPTPVSSASVPDCMGSVAVCVHRRVPSVPFTRTRVTPTSWTPSPPGSDTLNTKMAPDADTQTLAGDSAREKCVSVTDPSPRLIVSASRSDVKHSTDSRRS